MTLGRVIVGLLLLGALGVFIKLVLFLLGIYQPSPANIRPLYPEERTPAPQSTPARVPPPLVGAPAPVAAPEQIEPAAPPPPADTPVEKQTEALPLFEPEAPQPAPAPSEAVIAEPRASMSDSVPAGVAQSAQEGVVRYVIQPGDTLWDIAKKSCGGGARYRVLYQRNRGNIRNPHRIWPDQVIEFPDSCR